MDIIRKIQLSQKHLKNILSDEFDTSSIVELSINELHKLYRIVEPDNKYSLLSNCPGCCFSVKHKKIKNYNLHIVYYNFPSIGDTKSVKIQKNSFIDRIRRTYETNMEHQTDSFIVIINDMISESIVQINNSINILLHESDIDISHLNTPLESKHFRNVYIFDIKSLMFNMLEHTFVPNHEVIRESNDIEKILTDNHCTREQLPIILKSDPIAKLKLGVPGDIFKITRTSKTTGKYTYYRICK